LPVFSRGIALDFEDPREFIGVLVRVNWPCPFSAQANSRGSPFCPKGQAKTLKTRIVAMGVERNHCPGAVDAMKIRNFFPEFEDEGEVIAAFGQAKLVKYLNGKCELRGGSGEDLAAAKEWISMFWHEAVVREGP